MSTCELDRFVIQTPYIKVVKSCSGPFADRGPVRTVKRTNKRTDGRVPKRRVFSFLGPRVGCQSAERPLMEGERARERPGLPAAPLSRKNSRWLSASRTNRVIRLFQTRIIFGGVLAGVSVNGFPSRGFAGNRNLAASPILSHLILLTIR